MLSTSDVKKLHFKKIFIPSFLFAILISIICVILGFLMFDGNILILLVPLVIIPLSFVIPAVASAISVKKGEKAKEIFKSEGFTENFCEAYRQAYIDNKKNPFYPHLLLCASYYEKTGDNSTASIFLERINPKKLDSESKFVYCLEKLMICGKTGDWSEGEDFRSENIKFIQNYMEKKKDPAYKVQMYIALSLIDCAYKHYADAFSLLNFGYKPMGKNDVNFLKILITAVYIYAKMNDEENLNKAINNAEIFLSKFTEFEYHWCKEYYENMIKKASLGKL